MTGNQAGHGGRSEPCSAEDMTTIRLDTSVPNAARIYDYLLGGKDNYAADREAAGQIVKAIPHARAAAQQNREFLRRVVEQLAQEGIRQFLDIGSGLPTTPNVHQVAQGISPGCRVVYVDYDSVAVSHAKARLESGNVTAIGGDLRDPGQILRDSKALLDFSEPVAVLLFAVLHFLRDGEGPHGIVLTLKDALAPGSALAVSHITSAGIGPEKSREAEMVYRGASAPGRPPHARGHHAVFRRAGTAGTGRDGHRPVAGDAR